MAEQSTQDPQVPIGWPQAEPPEPLPGVVAINQQAHDVTTSNGDVVLAGGNISIQNNYYHIAEHKINIVSVLRLVRNLRKIHLDVLSKATPGTGIWLLMTDNFIIWLDPNGDLKILWGTGIPGAGKSVVASIVIKELETRAAAAGGSICVCYVYFRYSDGTDLTIRNVLEILVKQTVERHPDCASLAQETYSQHLSENTQPAEEELLQLLHRFAGAKSVTFYVLDALDEAPDRLQLELIKKLASLNIRLFVTSRPLRGVENRISGVHRFPIAAQAHDLELHINREIERSSDLQDLMERAGPSLREEIVSSIGKNCDGMFLHASLQLDAICECLSPGEVRRTLKVFPSNIEGVYLQTWDRILKRNPTRVSLAKTVLVWVLNAARSMTVEELECAVATSPRTYKFEPDEVVPGMTLVALCRGLVTFEEESGIVRLVHYTAKATLQGLIHDSYPHPHSHLATICMTHLTDCGFQNTAIRSEKEFIAARRADPLLAYASDAWAVHARASLDLDDPRMRMANFIGKSRAFPAFTSLDHLETFDILEAFHILAIYNLPGSLIVQDGDGAPNVTTRIGQKTPLMLASWHGHVGAAASFLSHPKTLVNLLDDVQWSALMFASRHGHEDIVKILLAHSEIRVNLVDTAQRSALMLATAHGNEGIVKLFLAHPEIQINLVNDRQWPALMSAARSGYQGIAQLLLARPEIQVNLVNNDRQSALMITATWGHEGIAQLILARPDVNVNLVTRKGWSVLMLASRYGRVGIVASLLARSETQVNQVDTGGWSALMAAAKTGEEGCIRLLVAHPEVQVNAVNKENWSALMVAAKSGQEGTVRVLLDVPHIDIATQSIADGHTAMSFALANGHMGIVQLLKEFQARREVDSDSQCVSSKTVGGSLEEESVDEVKEEPVNGEARDESDSEGSDQYEDAEEWLEAHEVQLI